MVADPLRRLFEVGPHEVAAFVMAHPMLLGAFDVVAAARLAAGLAPGRGWAELGERQRADLGVLHLIRGRPAEAVEVLRTVTGAAAAIHLGAAYEEVGDVPAAVRAYRSAVAGGGWETPTAAFRIGNLLNGTDPGRAITWYELAAQDKGEIGRAADYNRAILLAQRCDQQAATEAYRRALTSTSKAIRASAGNNLGNLLQHTDPVEAVAAYRTSIAAGFADAAVNMGNMWRDRGDLTSAVEAYRIAVGMPDPGQQARALANIGEVLGQANRTGEARTAFEQAIAVGDPEHSWRARYDLGRMLIHTGERGPGHRHLEICLRSPHKPIADRAREALDREAEPAKSTGRIALEFVTTADWTAAHQVLLTYRDRLDEMIAALAALAAEIEDPATVEDVRRHQRIAERAREIDVDGAFAEHSPMHGRAADGLVVRAVALHDALRTHRAHGAGAEAVIQAATALLDDPGWPQAPADFRADLLALMPEAHSAGGGKMSPALQDRMIDEMRDLLRAHPDRFLGVLTTNLAEALTSRGVDRRSADDLSEAVDLLDSMMWAPNAAPDAQALVHSQIALALARRAELDVATRGADLGRARALAAEALREAGAATQLGPVELALVHGRHAQVLATHHKLTGDENARDQAVDDLRRQRDNGIAWARPQDAYRLAHLLNNRGRPGDMTAAIDLLAEVADALTDGPMRDQVRYELHTAILQSPEPFTGPNVQRVAAFAAEQLAALDSASFDTRARLSTLLIRLAERTATVEPLEAAVQVWSAVPDPGPGRERLLLRMGYAEALSFRYEHAGDIDDLHQACQLFATAIEDEPDQVRQEPLTQYGSTLTTLGVATGELAYLDHAVEVLGPGADPQAFPGLTRRLAFAREIRGHELHEAADLRAAIGLHRGLTARPDVPVTERWTHAGDLATALLRYHDLEHRAATLSEAVVGLRAAIRDCPVPEAAVRLRNNLVGALAYRYGRVGDPGDLHEAVAEGERALADSRPDSALRPGLLGTLGEALVWACVAEPSPAAVAHATATLRAGCAAAAELRTSLRRAALVWAEWAGDRGEWAEVIEATGYGLAEAPALLRAQFTPAHKQASRTQSDTLSCLRAYAKVRLGDIEGAAVTIEQSLATMLSEALEREPADLARLAEQGHADLARRYRELVETIAGFDRRSGLLTGSPTTHPTQRMRQLRAELTALVEDIRVVPGFEAFVVDPGPADIIEAARIQPLAYVFATRWGGVGLVADQDGFRCAELPELDRDGMHLLAALLAGSKGPQLMTAVEATTIALGHAVMQPVLALLPSADALTMIPAGMLSVLPFHAAHVAAGIAQDQIHITYAPNARSLSYAERRSQSIRPSRLLIVDNPEPLTAPLHTTAEVTAARRRFPDHAWLAGEDATADAVMRLLPRHDVVHFACHGDVRLIDPLDTALRLAGDGRLPLRDLLLAKIDARLAVLSACDTSVAGYRHAHESVSLASTFLLGGAAGVIASLWPVPDVATDVLMAAFYTRWTDGVSPAEALRRAQRWIRTATNREIHDSFPSAAGSVPQGTAAYRFWAEAVAYEHPYYWAGFTYTGR